MRPQPRLGRVFAPDDRDRPMRGRLRPRRRDGRRWRRWWIGTRLDQGETGTCVAHGHVHVAENAPVTRPGQLDPFAYYRLCVAIDEFDENDHEALSADPSELLLGTSTRAGCKVGQDLGLWGEYVWAGDIDEVVDWVLEHGPVGIGIEWPAGFDRPDERNRVRLEGPNRGGHFLLVTGISLDRGLFELFNSWGEGYGNRGKVKLSIEELDVILFGGTGTRGEAVGYVELPWRDATPARDPLG